MKNYLSGLAALALAAVCFVIAKLPTLTAPDTNGRGTLSATWFETEFTNLIVFDFSRSPGTVRDATHSKPRRNGFISALPQTAGALST